MVFKLNADFSLKPSLLVLGGERTASQNVSFKIILRNSILGTVTTTELATGVGLGMVYALAFLLLAVKAFHHEKAIFRGA